MPVVPKAKRRKPVRSLTQRELRRQLAGSDPKFVVRRAAIRALQEQLSAIAQFLAARARDRAIGGGRRRRFTIMQADVEQAFRHFIEPRQLASDVARRLEALSREVRERAERAAEDFKEE